MGRQTEQDDEDGRRGTGTETYNHPETQLLAVHIQQCLTLTTANTISNAV